MSGPTVEPTNETGLSFTAGTATIAFVKKYADKAAFEAEFPRQNHTWQRVYTRDGTAVITRTMPGRPAAAARSTSGRPSR